MTERNGFTLVEMMVVIGIIIVLIGASLTGFSKMTKSAERARAQELVSNAATALTTYFQQEGSWPNVIAANGKSDGRLDAKVALALAKKRLFSLTTSGSGKDLKLDGQDQFGIVTPWATTVIKRLGNNANEGSAVGKATIKDHILHYAVDIDGDGIIKGANVGGQSLDIRATAAVWCVGKSGGNNGDVWPYSEGLKRDDVYSWTRGQTQNVQ